MARLGRRERLEKRKRLEALAALALSRKEAARRECEGLKALPKRERLLLQGIRPELGINRVNLLLMTHTKGCSAARGMAGQGSKGLVEKAKRKKLAFQGPRFAPAFMAPGHEELASNEPGKDVVEVLVPPETAFRKLG